MAPRIMVLRQEKHDLLSEWAAIDQTAAADGNRTLSEAERARVQAIETRVSDLNADILVEERRQAETLALPALPGQEPPRISGGHDRAADAPWGHEIPANASPTERTRLMEFAIGDYLGALVEAGRPAGRVDPRLLRAEVSGASSGVSSDAGFLVQTQMSDFLLQRAVETAVLAPLCDTIPIGEGADGLEAPAIDETSRATGSRWGGVQIYRAAEADTVTAKKPLFRKWELRLEDLMGLAYATDRSLRDATSLGAIFSRAFASEFAFVVDDEIVRGTGNGNCLGILEAPATVSQDKEAGQTADTVVSENLENMFARVHARSRAGGRWFYNQELEPQLHRLVRNVGTGGAPWPFVTYANEGAGPFRILGYPAVPIEQASAPGDVGDIFFANLSEYVLITKGGIDAQESMHVRFIYNERTFRWVYRINGQPKWSSALTPYKGSASSTQSPFVTLAAR